MLGKSNGIIQKITNNEILEIQNKKIRIIIFFIIFYLHFHFISEISETYIKYCIELFEIFVFRIILIPRNKELCIFVFFFTFRSISFEHQSEKKKKVKQIFFYFIHSF